MSERKNIDKLFQEKFKDFEAEPPEDSWSAIEAKLKEEKKDRKIIPFWWKLSGIAAALLLGFALADGYFNQKTRMKDPVVNKDRVVHVENPIQNNTGNIQPNPIGTKQPENAVADENTTDKRQSAKDILDTDHKGSLSPTANTNASIANSSSENRKLKTRAGTALVAAENNNSEKATDKKTRDRGTQNSDRFDSNASQNDDARVAANISKKKSNSNTNHQTANSSFDKKDPLPDGTHKPQQTISEIKPYINESDPVVASQNKINSKSDQPLDAKTVNSDNEAKSLAAAEKKKIDSTAIATVVPNALEELLNEKENNLVTKEPHVNRWQITSSVAPIYFGSTSGGSPIDSSFAGNSKDYKTNLSIGLGVNYAVTKKLKIRTGISQVTFNYNTNDIYISAGIQGTALKNVNMSAESQFINFNRNTGGVNLTSGTTELLSTETFQSYINQKMGYIEVPLELSYALLDKRFGLNIIGGVSTLFLNENKITIVSDGMKSNLGEANNLNKTHISSNIGLGVRYKIFRDLQANFEPMFKYQINTFSKDDGNFKPYYFGLYTGLSYSF